MACSWFFIGGAKENLNKRKNAGSVCVFLPDFLSLSLNNGLFSAPVGRGWEKNREKSGKRKEKTFDKGLLVCYI
jgi:hypothetical protein